MADAQFILASGSPRRREVLSGLGYRFVVGPVPVDETPRPGEDPVALVQRLAVVKAEAGLAAASTALPSLGSDTIVALDGAVLGKPVDRADALDMLERLSGSTHLVHTAVALARPGDATRTVLSTSTVWFRSLLPGEAAAYWETGEPRDKAGAYGIQGIGGIFVRRLDGSFSGVMGLPVAETEALLRGAGIQLWAGTSSPG